MSFTRHARWIGLLGIGSLVTPCLAVVDDFHFSTGNVTNLMAMASRPGVAGKTEIEAADDFLLSAPTAVDHATFTGVIVANPGAIPSIGAVTIEFYRIFPLDSTNPPSGHVPTRINSPSDVAFSVASSGTNFNFATSTLSATFSALNSIQPGGIHASPNQTTGGNGAVTGTEMQFDVTFITPLTLPADHYFFVPQVQVTGGEFMWLSGTRPLVAPGTPFTPDLQAWTRDAGLDPDWLKVGADIVGGTTPPTFNGAFTLDGATVPEPGSLAMLVGGAAMLLGRRRGA